MTDLPPPPAGQPSFRPPTPYQPLVPTYQAPQQPPAQQPPAPQPAMQQPPTQQPPTQQPPTQQPPTQEPPTQQPLPQPASHRKQSWASRAGRFVGAVVIVLLTLVAGQAILKTEPDRYETTEPFYYQGEPGEPVTAGGLRVTVLGARGAAKAGPSGGLATDTSGVWVIVRVRVEATEKTTRAPYFALADDQGRIFRATGRFKQILAEGGVDLHPGIPVEGEAAFEVPRSAIGVLRLRVSEHTTDITGGDLQPFTDIRVPVTDADVARWLNDPEPAKLVEPKVAN